MPEKHALELTPEQLRRRCDPSKFPFKDTSELTPESTIYGQPRGVRAIEFGIDMHSRGYNMFVLGPSGSGRVTAIRHFIDSRTKSAPTPPDWCYVFNFREPHKPRALRLPSGMGRAFQGDMQTLITTLRDAIPRMFESDTYLQARSELTTPFSDQRDDMLEQVHQMAASLSLAIQYNQQGGIAIIPMKDGEAVPQEEFDRLSEEERGSFTRNRRRLEEALESAFRVTRTLQVQVDIALRDLRRETAEQIVDMHVSDVLKKYDLSGDVIHFLWSVYDDILDSLDLFDGADQQQQEPNPEEMGGLPIPIPIEERFRRYAVNVLVENEPGSGAPIVMLDLPTYQNLVGRIEHEIKFGALTTDFSHIKSGGLHRANGGFLLIRAMDLLRQPFAWDALKRALLTDQIIIEDPESRGVSVMTTQQLEPEPIPADLKVILIGDAELYYALYSADDDFQDLFRVKADFGDTMPRNFETEMDYGAFIATHCRKEKLPHFDAGAVARIVEYGSWMVADQRKLSTQFGELLPLIREAAFYARRHRRNIVTADDVYEAIRERIYRNNEIEELSQEQIADGSIFIDLDGECAGQINGLVVVIMGDHSFGLPGRITARVFMGRDNVVQIDRESALTGPIHNKGVMILEGYVGGRYAQDYPLTLSASITFEQSYGEVEGDSASSTELYALLSAIADLPVRQDLAVTGSINQRGQVQPIGGVTQKIEGFYNSCKQFGLTGRQGVIIPRANLVDLMVNDEVITAVRDGQFHIYAVSHVDEGIALLTGKPIEEIHELVQNRLRDLAEKLAHFEDSNGDDEEAEGETEAAPASEKAAK